MTNANTPTTRERAEQNAIQLVANLNINQALSNNYESTFEIIVQAFAAALARERREAIEIACAAVCEHCAAGLELTETADDCFHTLEVDGELPRFPNCKAAPIRAAAVEAMREKP